MRVLIGGVQPPSSLSCGSESGSRVEREREENWVACVPGFMGEGKRSVVITRKRVNGSGTIGSSF